jgi:polygalacturonase
MKHYPFMLCAIFLLFFSCKKADNANSISRQQALLVNTTLDSNNAINTTGFLIDTIPPANAVSVKKFGAVGDGTHDDTNDIQAALNSETVLTLPAGTYLINNTLNMRPGVKLYGTGGAIIKAGDNMQGTLLSRGMYFYVSNTANCLISNINFQKSTQPFNLGAWGNACV